MICTSSVSVAPPDNPFKLPLFLGSIVIGAVLLITGAVCTTDAPAPAVNVYNGGL